MLKITALSKSVRRETALSCGDIIRSVNGYPAVDELDLLYFAGETVLLEVEGKGEVRARADEIQVKSEQAIRTCHNHCTFCFVDQMPKGMRESLYVKDDDYAMSFECGNFVTLTNLKEEELERIIRLKLSPLYVSVHTVNPALRCELLNNRFAGKIEEQIRRLAEGGISVHCQAVIVPHKNDGEDLKNTARTLFRYFPQVCDLAVVPTGLTKYREGLTQIPDIDGEYSAKFLDTVDELNQEFGVNFVLPADEYFIKAKRALKPAEFYGDFAQIENGIGMTSKFIADFHKALQPAARKKHTRVVSVCGVSAAETVQSLCEQANESIENLQARALPVKNSFFGESVTCTGLLTGQDILAALQAEKGSYDEVILASDTLKSFEEVFLCGMTLKDLKKKVARQSDIRKRLGRRGIFPFAGWQKIIFRNFAKSPLIILIFCMRNGIISS